MAQQQVADTLGASDARLSSIAGLAPEDVMMPQEGGLALPGGTFRREAQRCKSGQELGKGFRQIWECCLHAAVKRTLIAVCEDDSGAPSMSGQPNIL